MGKCSVNLFKSVAPRQSGGHFPDDIFKCIFMNEKFCILIWIWMKFVPKVPINNIPVFAQMMAWRRSGEKPLSEPTLTRFTDAYMHHLGEMSYNSLAPARCGSNFKCIIFRLIIQNSGLNTHYEIALRWMPQNCSYEKSTLVQVMA